MPSNWSALEASASEHLPKSCPLLGVAGPAWCGPKSSPFESAKTPTASLSAALTKSFSFDNIFLQQRSWAAVAHVPGPVVLAPPDRRHEQARRNGVSHTATSTLFEKHSRPSAAVPSILVSSPDTAARVSNREQQGAPPAGQPHPPKPDGRGAAACIFNFVLPNDAALTACDLKAPLALLPDPSKMTDTSLPSVGHTCLAVFPAAYSSSASSMLSSSSSSTTSSSSFASPLPGPSSALEALSAPSLPAVSPPRPHPPPSAHARDTLLVKSASWQYPVKKVHRHSIPYHHPHPHSARSKSYKQCTLCSPTGQPASHHELFTSLSCDAPRQKSPLVFHLCAAPPSIHTVASIPSSPQPQHSRESIYTDADSFSSRSSSTGTEQLAFRRQHPPNATAASPRSTDAFNSPPFSSPHLSMPSSPALLPCLRESSSPCPGSGSGSGSDAPNPCSEQDADVPRNRNDVATPESAAPQSDPPFPSVSSRLLKSRQLKSSKILSLKPLCLQACAETSSGSGSAALNGPVDTQGSSSSNDRSGKLKQYSHDQVTSPLIPPGWPYMHVSSAPCLPSSALGHDAAAAADEPKALLFSSEPSQILPYLYLGNHQNGSDLDSLEKYHIKFVLNVAKECPSLCVDGLGHIRCQKCDLTDSFSQNISSVFETAFAFIDEASSTNQKILIHCMAGISRSATITIAYLMRTYKMKLQDAYRFVKERRPEISPNLNFMGQLVEYEKELFGQEHCYFDADSCSPVALPFERPWRRRSNLGPVDATGGQTDGGPCQTFLVHPRRNPLVSPASQSTLSTCLALPMLPARSRASSPSHFSSLEPERHPGGS